MKKWTSLLLSAVMVLAICVSAFTVPASAEEATNNLALNKPYEISSLYPTTATASYPDEDGKTLTDGVVSANAAYNEPSYMGFNSNCEDYKQLGYSWARVDLGAVCKLDKLALHTSGYVTNGGIKAPLTVSYYVADEKDGPYTLVGSVVPDNSDGLADSANALEVNAHGRYVEARFTANSTWMFVSEFEVFGGEYEAAEEGKVNLDGKLDEAAWANANWMTVTNWLSNNDAAKVTTETVKSAVRADDNYVYVAVKLEHKLNPISAADLASAFDANITKGSRIRLWVGNDANGVAGFYDVCLHTDGTIGTYFKKVATNKISASWGNDCFEVAIPRTGAEVELGGAVKLNVNFSDNCFGPTKDQYNQCHTSSDPGNAWKDSTAYPVYKLSDLKLSVAPEITVDGDLLDSGWMNAEWKDIPLESWLNNNDDAKKTEEIVSYAVRSDKDNFYVAVKLQHTLNAINADDLAAAFDANISKGSRIRLWVGNGAGGVAGFYDVCLKSDGTTGAYFKKAASEKFTAACGDDCFEVAIPRTGSDVEIGDTVSFNINFSDNCFGPTGDQYNQCHTSSDPVNAWKSSDGYPVYKLAEYDVNLVALPEEANAISHVGYPHGDAKAAVVLAGDGMTVGQLTAKGRPDKGSKDLAYWTLLLVDFRGVVVDVLESGDGKAKTDVVCPKGGYILGAWTDSAAAHEAIGKVEKGARITLYNVDLSAVRTGLGNKAAVNAGYTYVNPTPAPEGAISIGHGGCYYAAGASIIMAGDNETVGQLTERTWGSSKNLNYFKLIVVDKYNQVIEVNTALGTSVEGGIKTDMVCPEGGYIIGFHGDAEGSAAVDSIEVGSYVELYNIDISEIRALDCYVELIGAAFTVARLPAAENELKEGDNTADCGYTYTFVAPSAGTYMFQIVGTGDYKLYNGLGIVSEDDTASADAKGDCIYIDLLGKGSVSIYIEFLDGPEDPFIPEAEEELKLGEQTVELGYIYKFTAAKDGKYQFQIMGTGFELLGADGEVLTDAEGNPVEEVELKAGESVSVKLEGKGTASVNVVIEGEPEAGDAGIILFAIIGMIALAGAAVTIKVRA